MNRIIFGTYLLFLFLSISCATTAVKTPPPELPTFESALQKIKQDSPDIKKYYLFDETGALIVRGNIEHFQAQYDLKNLHIESAGTYAVPFTVQCLETGELREDTLLWQPKKDGAGILLSFDDNFFDTWERYFDLLDRYNAHVTFFVLGKYSAFSDAAMRRGHDIGYHSMQHSILPKVSRQAFFTEALSQVASFRNAGVPLVAFAYPFGFYEPWMNDELLKTYRILRGFNTGFQAYQKMDIMRDGFVFSKSVDNILFEREDDFTSAIDRMFRAVKFAGQDLILPLTSHSISDGADWGIKPRRLEYMLQAANDLQLHFYRYRDIL